MNLYTVHLIFSAIGGPLPVCVGFAIGMLIIDGHWIIVTALLITYLAHVIERIMTHVMFDHS